MKFLEEKKLGAFYRNILRWAIVGAIFVFLGKMVWDHWNQVKDAPFTLRPVPFISSTLLFVLSYFIQIWAWYLITLKLRIAVSMRETLESWFYSQLGKYLPGKVWLLLSRFYFYESKGKSKKAISVALFVEAVTMIVAAGLMFLGALLFFKEVWPSYAGRQSLWLVLVFLLGFLSLHPRVLQKILNWALVRFKRDPVSLPISYPDILWILFVSIISWVVGGVGFYLFVDSVYPVAPQYVLFLTGALAISSTVGLIALFAPGGLGVREGALVYLLSLVMAAPVAVIISILSRIWMTLIEIGLVGMVYLISQFQRRLEKEDQNV
ncbi:MAG: lysylphosphatidylglycerol synthase transmembrane domain-containing protein [bacterium]